MPKNSNTITNIMPYIVSAFMGAGGSWSIIAAKPDIVRPDAFTGTDGLKLRADVHEKIDDVAKALSEYVDRSIEKNKFDMTDYLLAKVEIKESNKRSLFCII